LSGYWFRMVHVLLALTCVGGCTTLEPSKIEKEPFVLSKTYRNLPQKSAQQAQAGEIWQGGLTSLFSDQRAKGIGDIVTVKIVEVSQASESATTDTARKSDLKAGVTNLFNLESHASGPWTNMPNLINAGSSNNDFSGSGATTRTGSLSATITARIMDVLPNGNLAIEGKREIYVNNEKKEILLQGVVRPRDIAFDNSVLSTQVADAKIIYTGIGVLAEKQRPGWATRIFDYVWPF
jgi:flagellar L-ring protein FlgH